MIKIQTFLSELTYAESAGVLDNIRLQCQFKEGWQILDAIAKTPAGPRTARINGRYPFASNHPATNMWRGHEYQLMVYLRNVRDELASRHIKWDTIWDKLQGTWFEGFGPEVEQNKEFPWWWSDWDERVKVIRSHRYNLYNKDKDFYADYKSDAEKFAQDLADTPLDVVCCTTHAPYWYPTHRS